MEAIVQRYFEMVNKDDVDGLLSLWDDNGTFEIPLRGRLKGKEEIRKFYESLPALYAAHHDGPVKSVIAGNEAVVKVAVTNTTREGKTITFDAVSWMTFGADKKLLSIEAKFDTAKLLKDLKG
ncbi:MAG: nuclear transport factor 2 family protein [Desulfuromonadales bacterium]|nr:nuclear transport factor 2 family protein [Desulfuromonadales bacterium]